MQNAVKMTCESACAMLLSHWLFGESAYTKVGPRRKEGGVKAAFTKARNSGKGRMLKKFKDLSEKEILALAISSEEEDGRIYGEFADALRETYPSTAKMFEEMR